MLKANIVAKACFLKLGLSMAAMLLWLTKREDVGKVIFFILFFYKAEYSKYKKAFLIIY